MRKLLKAIWFYKKEITTYLSLITGWSLITFGLIDIFGIIAAKFSGGLFLIGMSIGYKPLFTHLIYGLYSLSEE